jgi:uncharacterized Rmd1/YagE family protein
MPRPIEEPRVRASSVRPTDPTGARSTSATGSDRLRALALALGERIDLPRLGGKRLGPGQALLDVGRSGHAVVFRYGCAVLFDASPEEQQAFARALQEFVHESFPLPDTESAEFAVGTGDSEPAEGELALADKSPDSLEIVADVLAKSVALAHYETEIASAFDRVEPLAIELERKGRVSRRHGELVRHVASALLTQQRMAGRIEVTEKPDVLWDRPDLERLFALLVDEYELKERALALERKLTLLSRTAEVFLNLLYDRRTLRVEWYIVILILVEILITVWTLAFM